MDALELIRRYEKGERDFSGINLSKAKLIGANLPGINLWGADLTGANLAKAKLWGANLSLANLAQANLTRANLSGANLQQANLRGTRLYYIKYYGANFIDCTYDTSTRFSRGFDPTLYNMRLFE
ncbi:pentapeptide repeat-containing protein [Calothrix sp. NIES-4071]|nr:pentapeptide repeat-containing protein [Calothrix sp. NIES-4071]BAZ61761.1 pentapeptide repeat-containing protein [Calothrix sp. NIES-4105]